MTLNSADIQNKEFERAFRGYNADDVDDFLESIALDYDVILKENKDLREQVNKLSEERKHYQKIEEAANKAIGEAEQAAEKEKESAQEEIQTIRAEAEKEIERLNQEYLAMQRENEELREQVYNLNKESMGFDKIEETIQNAVNRSQEAAEEVLSNARHEADLIRQEADVYKKEAEELRREAEAETRRINEDYESLMQQNRQLEEQIEQLSEKNKNYEKLEETVHNAIMVAQEAADDLKENAKRESELIRKEAEREAQRIVEDARYQASRILAEHEDLHKQVQVFKMRFRSFIEAQLSSLETEDLSDSFSATHDKE